MAYNLTLNNQQLQLSLARTGGQGSQGNSVTSASIDSNGDFHIIISNASGQQVQDINLGGATIIAEAIAAKNAAEAALDTFDDRFLGVKSSAPGLDNDNDALVTGALYFDSTISHLGVYNGSTWVYPLQAAQTSATAAAASETAAATSETNAGTSETNAATSATNAANSAAQAASSESTVAASATTASTAATNALASQSAAATSEANAATSETNAATSETNAGNSATAAAASGVYANNRATAAAASAAAALVSENNSATSESSAASSATTAGIHSTNAAANAVSANNSKTAAASSETNALNYQSGAQTAETNAATSETNAASSATAAATSATNSATSATASASSASAAQTAQAATELVFDNFDDKFLGTKTSDPTVDNDGNALVEGSMYYNSTDNVIKFYSGSAWQAPSVTATNAATSATTSATNASTSATNAATSETNAAASAASSLTSANNAAASYDSFDDRYLGSKSSAPTTDNDGNSLLTGALYWNSTLDKMYVYTGAIWTVATGSIPGIKMEFVYTATAGQTAFTGSDDNSETLVMDDTKLVDVFLNGIRLVKGTDYTLNLVTDTVTFASGRTVNDMVVVQVFGNLAAAGLSISGANLTGGTINNAVIGGTTPAAGSFTTITATGTIDGRDVAADGTKLDGIETAADVTDTANVTAAGALMTTGGSVTGNVSFGDNDKAIFGAGNDLSIFHNGSTSLIADNGTGGITLRSDIFTVQNAAGNETVAQFVQDGFVKLFHNNSQVFTTTSTGASITGSLGIGISSPVYPLVVQAANPRLQLLGTGTNTGISGLLFGDADTATRGQINYNHSSDSLDIVVNAQERMRITSSGSVGIGTSSPSGDLHVYNSTAGEQYISSSNSALRFVSTGGANYIQSGTATSSSSAADLIFTNVGGSGETMRIDSSGDVSFSGSSGTAGTVKGNGTVTISDNHGSNNGGGLAFHYTGNSGYSQVYVKNNNTLVIDADPTAAGGSTNIEFNIDGSEAMRIDSSGNVGIGTSSPARTLEVYSSAPAIKLNNGTNAFTIGTGAFVDGSNSLVFFDEGVGERMRLNSAGCLSLGNNLTNPDNSLLHLTANSADNFSLLQLESNEGSASTAPDIALYRNSASPADGDNIGALHFYANNSVSTRTLFGNLYHRITDVTDGTEDSKFEMYAMQSGSLNNFLSVGSNASGTGEVVVNEGSGDINFRVETDTSANAFLVDAGTNFIGMYSASAVALDGYTERVRIASDGNNLGGSLVMSANNGSRTGNFSENDIVFYDMDNATANSQGLGNIRWYSLDASGAGEGFKIGIKGRGQADGAAFFEFYGSSNTSNYDKILSVGVNQTHAGVDNLRDLGSNSVRWDDVFATNGTINTSDERLKQQVATLNTNEINAAKAISALFKTYKWNDKVAEKGDNARIHSGVIAQQVKAAMEANSLDPMKYAFMCWDEFYQIEMSGDDIATPYVETFEVDDPEIPEGATYVDRYSIRYSELMSFIHAATEQRLASIESRLDALEAE